MFSTTRATRCGVAAIMHAPVLLVYTHDSIGLGEDGPTHQPIEHLASLRAMPTCTSGARRCRGVRRGLDSQASSARPPTALVFTRQALPQPESSPERHRVRKGGYVLIDSNGPPEAIVIANRLRGGHRRHRGEGVQSRGKRVRLGVLPCCEAFDAQPAPIVRACCLVGDAPARGGSRQHAVVVALRGQQRPRPGYRELRCLGQGVGPLQHFGLTSADVKQHVDNDFLNFY